MPIFYVITVQHNSTGLFPHQFDCIENLCDSAILCATNSSVATWNDLIQKYNPNEEHKFYSNDTFDMVDDPKNVLHNMITPNVLNRYNNNSVPAHKLVLKENDICFIMRNLFKNS